MEENLSMTDILQTKLRNAFSPDYLEVVNESFKHRGHSGDNGTGETHFAITIVSSHFKGKSQVTCHRMIYSVLKQELSGRLHAISIKALEPELKA